MCKTTQNNDQLTLLDENRRWTDECKHRFDLERRKLLHHRDAKKFKSKMTVGNSISIFQPK